MHDRELNEYEIQVLQKGAKFTTTSKRKKEEFKSNVSEYCRKLRLKEHFPGKDNDESIERKKKKFILSRMRKDRN